MIPNSPIGSSQLILPRVGAEPADGASASAAGASAAGTGPSAAAGSSAPTPTRSTSASAASAARAVVSAHAISAQSTAPRIPHHALGAAGAAKAPSVVTPANDALSIIASYLPLTDRQVMRSINTTMHKIVDPSIHTLKLTVAKACAMLSQPHALHNLDALHLTDCTHARLADLATILARMPHPDFELILEPDVDGNRVRLNEDDLLPLLPLNLRGLTLKDTQVSVAMARELAQCSFPVSISLPGFIDYRSEIEAISQMPNLHSLKLGPDQSVSHVAIDALGSHASLQTLEFISLSADEVIVLARSASIRSLTVANISGDEAAAVDALADNTTLTRLAVGVYDASSLAALSRNVTLQTLIIAVVEVPPLGLLATIPSLKDLLITGRENATVSIEAIDIEALCTKPLNSLVLYGMSINGDARLLLATTQATRLSLHACTPFDSADFAVLGRNRSITSLFMAPIGGHHDVDDVLSLVQTGLPQLEWLNITARSPTLDMASTHAIRRAWTASGRLLANLFLDVQHF